MGGFGERMQREREMRGITLEEIAESTKIGTRSLRALEEEDFAKLPGGIFNRGFVRAYARYLGIDEEQAVADFVAAAAQAEAAKPATEAPERPILVDEPEPERNWSGVALLVMLAALVVAGWRLYPTLERLGAHAWSGAARSAAPAPAAARSATNPATTVAPSAPPAPVTPASSTPQNAAALSSQADAGAPPPPAAATGGFVVEIRASKVSWVSITADGKLFSQGMLGAQQVKLVRAQNRVVLKMGNAGGIEVSHNGKPLPALGGDGQAATVVFTPEGVQR